MYNDDAFATMLLTVPLSADRAEYARPLSTPEYSRMLARVKSSAAARLGALLHVDISGLMMLLGVGEEEAYRLYTLLHRGVQLTYALEGFLQKGVRIITAAFSSTTSDTLRAMCDKIRDFAPNCVAVLAGINDGKATFAAVVGPNAQEKGAHAGNIVKQVAQITGGKGGGRADSAMAGAKDLTKIDEALAAVEKIVLDMVK